MTYVAYKCDIRRMQPSVWETAYDEQAPLICVSVADSVSSDSASVWQALIDF